MNLELIASVGMLGLFIWACRFLLPRALKDRDSLGISAAVLTGLLALFGWLLVGIAVRALAGLTPAQVQSLRDPAGRAVAYLSEEVPRWRREHACYSCHNNADAVRALLAASKRGHQVQPAIADSVPGLRPRASAAAAGAFGSATDVCFMPSNETTVSLPAPSTRTRAGLASLPVPRITAM